jgi:hypothetical protein
MDEQHRAQRAAGEERAAQQREIARRRLAAERARGNGEPDPEGVILDEEGNIMRRAVSFGPGVIRLNTRNHPSDAG